LLYGMNASGKSSYMKSVGLAIVMSQMGCWVPCESFTHVPITKLFTRISGNDDYMRGKSSFALEIEEFNMILKEADSRSIVLGDELCRGTEHVSGTAIVGSGIRTLL
jgi:DNA mismatch repair protein MutS